MPLRPSFNFNTIPPQSQMHLLSASPFQNFELTRILGTAPTGGCAVAELLEAIARIRKHDPESWYSQFHALAVKAESQAHELLNSGQRHAAHRAFLRATSYFRAAPYMLVPTPSPPDVDRRVLHCAERSALAFQHAARYSDEYSLVDFEIPFEGHRLPGYLLLPRPLPLPSAPAGTSTSSVRHHPVLLNIGGADSTKEELFFMLGAPALKLDYAVILFDGPGQGLALKRDKIPMTPAFERVTDAVLDALWDTAERHPEYGLDLGRVAVAGTSLGGHFALRAAAGDGKRGASASSTSTSTSENEHESANAKTTAAPRIAACAAVDAVYSMWDVAATRMPGWYLGLWTSGYLPESVFDWSCQQHMGLDFATRWEFALVMWIMGCGTPGEVLRAFQRYSLRTAEGAEMLADVRCPVLLTGAPDTIYVHPALSSERIRRELSGVREVQVWVPEGPGEGSLTGKVGAWEGLAGRVFAFLDRVMGVRR
ncbi:alpha/beta hydrolase family protein [Aspergillus mulundensis]|uniref:AB hydrolase-1 domain-containing protein n=1 Tax=Aspergillus mulundensis TaxID=1810919 RepID=A0A3D8QIX3_9EURO|nr:hypothetical protein DSM5745_10444 [Aspergillus mulundensis]RDW61772.1 hypothetical protein DSM5745_10444 [Aspergillus mulundensis]